MPKEREADTDGPLRRRADARPDRCSASGNLVANVLAIDVIAVFAVIVWGTRVGFTSVFGDILGDEVREKAPVNTLPTMSPKSAPAAGSR